MESRNNSVSDNVASGSTNHFITANGSKHFMQTTERSNTDRVRSEVDNTVPTVETSRNGMILVAWIV